METFQMYQIYLMANQIAEKYYVGQTMQGLSNRLSDHRKAARKGVETYLYKSMRFYGEQYFTICYLGNGGKTQDEANVAERFWIALLKSNNPEFGYNLTSGGGAGRILSESSRKKIGDSCRKPSTPEQECCGCHRIKPLEEYHINNAVSNGRMSRCKECCLQKAREIYAPQARATAARIEATKNRVERACNRCGIVKHLDDFPICKSAPDGHRYSCNGCWPNRHEIPIRKETDLSPCLENA
jgi:group I intron endonuclease